MSEFFYDSYRLLIGAFLLGVALGVLYDVFRVLRISRLSQSTDESGFLKKIKPKKPLFKEKKGAKKAVSAVNDLLVFIEDILFFIIAAAAEILFFLGENDGEIRIYCIIFTVFGFFLYIKTIGRIVIYFSSKIIFFVRCLLYWMFYIIIVPVRYILRVFCKLGNVVYAVTAGKIVSALKKKRSDALKNDFLKSALDGFGIFGEDEIYEKQ